MAKNKRTAAAGGLRLASRSMGGGLGRLAQAQPDESVQATSRDGQAVEFGKVLPIEVSRVMRNPRNDYESMSDAELRSLAESIERVGVLNALIVRDATPADGAPAGVDYVLVCGENRFRACGHAGLLAVPARRVMSPAVVSPALEDEIMEAENDRRRGGSNNAAKKKAWIDAKFGARLRAKKHGGGQGSGNLAAEIERESRGKIPKGTAQRLLAELRRDYAEAAANPKRGAALKKGAKNQRALRPPEQLVEWRGWEALSAAKQRKVLQALDLLEEVGLPKKLRQL
ncbi:MAG: ParB N-terminal domain-containing protein [bacterium]|nr:ParB N-terminal domain-containing protein [bacterium]